MSAPLHLMTIQDSTPRFENVVLETQGPLSLYLVRLLGDADEARDVLQEAYLRASQQTGFLDAEFNQRAWLYKVAGNLAKSNLRRLTRWFRNRSAPSTSEDPLERILKQEKERDVRQALAGLPYKQRQILLLRYYMELPYTEIAEVLDIPVGTVMSRLNRAKERLEGRLV